MVFYFVIVLNGLLFEFEQKIFDVMFVIECWFRFEWQEYILLFYCLVDLCNVGFKLVFVDVNLFFGVFNNLLFEVLLFVVQVVMVVIEKICLDVKNLFVIFELLICNVFYLENVVCFVMIMCQVGLNVCFGLFDLSIIDMMLIMLVDGQKIVFELFECLQCCFGLKNFDLCLILLNNDLLVGILVVLENLYEQYLLLLLYVGWVVCCKLMYFLCYDDVVKKFVKMVGVDLWMVNLYFVYVEGVDWQVYEGEQVFVDVIDGVLKKIVCKYCEYGISEKLYVVVKVDVGIVGCGVMIVYDVVEIGCMMKVECVQMVELKVGFVVCDVIVQEGVYMFECVGDEVVELVVYMIDCYVVGGFYCMYGGCECDQNLNVLGMYYVLFGFEYIVLLDVGVKLGVVLLNCFYMYGVVVWLLLIVLLIELEKIDFEVIQV